MPYLFSLQSPLNDVMKPLKPSEFSDIPDGIQTGYKVGLSLNSELNLFVPNYPVNFPVTRPDIVLFL